MKVSVIMPCYRVEGYIRRAIDSVLEQTMADFELILVDDGSPDRSGEICDDYARRDGRLRVIHQENRGASAARNAAIDIARGEYLFFCDADDWMEPDMLETLVSLAEETHAQLAVCGFTIDTDTNHDTLRQTIVAPDAFYPTKEAFRAAAAGLFDNNLLYSPWNKLFPAARVRAIGLRFPDTFWDDFPFNLGYLRDVESVAVSSRALYHFTRSRVESETARYVPAMYEKREEEDGWMRDLYAYWGVDAHEFLARRYAERLVGCVENLTNPQCTLSRPEKLASIRAMLNTPRAREALSLARPQTALLRAMFLPLRKRRVYWTYMQSEVITFTKSHASHLFATLKAARGKARTA